MDRRRSEAGLLGANQAGLYQPEVGRLLPGAAQGADSRLHGVGTSHLSTAAAIAVCREQRAVLLEVRHHLRTASCRHAGCRAEPNSRSRGLGRAMSSVPSTPGPS